MCLDGSVYLPVNRDSRTWHGALVSRERERVDWGWWEVRISCKSDAFPIFLRRWRSPGTGTALVAEQLIAQYSEGSTKYS